MSMTFVQLQTELAARGFDYLTSTRAKQFLNTAYAEINDAADFPYLQTTTSGAAPLTISDLSRVQYVIDTTNQSNLTGVDPRFIADLDTTVTTAGTPLYWWLDGLTTLKVYPTSTTATLSVRYLKIATELSADADVNLLPSRFHPLIVDGAVCWALKDGDDYNTLQVAQQQYAQGLQRMIAALTNRNFANPDSILVTSPTWDS